MPQRKSSGYHRLNTGHLSLMGSSERDRAPEQKPRREKSALDCPAGGEAERDENGQ